MASFEFSNVKGAIGFHFLRKILKYMYHSIRHELLKVYDRSNEIC